MAGVNWQKMKSAQQNKAMFKHDDEEERLKTENHANEHINKDLTKNNLSYYGLSYSEVCEKYDNAIRKLDENPNQNKRKDRVTGIGLEFPRPNDLPKEQQAEWFKDVCDILAERYGDNLLEAYWHVDEVHEYTDAETGEKRISLEHGHAYIIPNEKGKLLAKEISSRKNMIALNTEINRMTQEKYGVAFVTGKGNKSKKSVEQLKRESEIKEWEQDKQEWERDKQEWERDKQEWEKKKQQALEYDVGEKPFFESKANYESRKKAHEQATAAMQQKAENDERERNLDEEVIKRGNVVGKQLARQIKTKRESELEQQVQQRDETINRMQITMSNMQKQLDYFSKYKSEIAEIDRQRKNAKLDDMATGKSNSYTFANDSYRQHSGL